MQDLQTLVEKTVTQLEYELVDFEITNRGKLLRVFIDKLNPKDIKDSVTIDDCVLVSNQLGNVLTVEHEIDYDRLEVSSAGMDRVLNNEKDFLRFNGLRAQIKLKNGVKEKGENVPESALPRKTFLGQLEGFSDGCVLLKFENEHYAFELKNVDQARLSPEF